MKTKAEEVAHEIEDLSLEIDEWGLCVDGNAAIKVISTALSEAYAAGRAAGVEEAAAWHETAAKRHAEFPNRAVTLQAELAEDTIRFDHEQHAKSIRALIPRLADDTPASLA